MKLSEITIIYKRTVQMRNFEPAEVSIMIKAQVDPGETVAVVAKKLRDQARLQVETERNYLLDERIASIENEKEKSA